MLTRRIAGLALGVVLAGCGGEPREGSAPEAGQATAGAGSAPAAAEPAPRLAPGAVVERAIEGGSRHLYRLTLAAGDFVDLSADQRGADVVVTLSAPDGSVLLEVDSPSGDLGAERIPAVAARSGEHTLEVRAFPGPTGRYALSIDAVRQATPEDRARAAAATDLAAGQALEATGDAAAAGEAYRRALAAARALGDPAGQAHAEDRLGRLAASRRDAAAAGHFRRAAEHFAAAGEGRWQGLSLTSLGNVRLERAELYAAAESYRTALDLRRAAGDAGGEATLLFNLARVDTLLGEPGRALERYETVLEIRGRRGEEDPEALHDLGVLLLNLGRPREALDRLRGAEAVTRRTGAGAQRAGTLLEIGRAESALGREDRAAAAFEQALDLARRHGDARRTALALSHLGVLAYEGGELQTARRRHEEALAGFRDLGDPAGVGASLTSLGTVALAAGDPASAREHLAEASAPLRDAVPWLRAASLRWLAVAEIRLGRPDAAREAAEAAVEIVDSPRARLGSLALTASYSARVQPYFSTWIETLMALHRREPGAGWDVPALAASERARARSFLDAAGRAGAGETPPAAGDEAARESASRRRLNALEAERAKLERQGEPAALTAAVEREIRGALADLDRLDRRHRRAAPRSAAVARLRPATPAEIQRLLPSDAALLEIELGRERSYLWIVTRDGIESRELPGRRELEETARSAYQLLVRSHRREAEAAASQALCRLSRALLAPAAGALAARRLVVVGEGALLYLPFAALPHPPASPDSESCGPAPLAATHAVVQLPSASLLGALGPGSGERGAAGGIAVVGDPELAPGGPFRPLPFARREAEAVLARAPAGRTLAALGFDAAKETVLGGALAGFRYVHFATHGVIDPRHPELSALVLSTVDPAGRRRDGLLRAHEIGALDLDAELVTLSACRTALGAEAPGEGLIGLTRSFFEAGARSLLVSLWSVDDRSTAVLMDRFYAELFAGRPPARALARAQASMAADPAWRAPYHWAGFVLQGPLAAEPAAGSPGR